MAHAVVEDYRKDCLDICEMRRQGLLDGKRLKLEGGIRWPRLASVTIDPTAIQLTHSSGQQQLIRISWAKCFANSYRPWLVCTCGNRFARLYRGFAGYACRQCLGAWYTCQKVSTRKRQMKRLSKIAAQIDSLLWQYIEAKHIVFPQRPPGMHRRRYYRLRGLAADIEAKLALRQRFIHRSAALRCGERLRTGDIA